MLQYIILICTIPLIIIFSKSSFKKDKVTGYYNNAEITGIDKSMRPCNATDLCNCPGGFFIHIDDVPDPKGTCTLCSSFKTMLLPSNFVLEDGASFPVKVIIEWKYDALSCDSSRIDIISMVRR